MGGWYALDPFGKVGAHTCEVPSDLIEETDSPADFPE